MTAMNGRLFAVLSIVIVAALSVYLVTPSVPMQLTTSWTVTTMATNVGGFGFTFAEVSSTPTSTAYGYNYVELVTVTFPGPSLCSYPAYCTFTTFTYLAENPNPQWATTTLYSQSTFTTTSSSFTTTILPATYGTVVLQTSTMPPYVIGPDIRLIMPLLLAAGLIVALWFFKGRARP